jgi:hypothetical protein
MSKKRDYIRNHYVPKTYLKRFTDPRQWNYKVQDIDCLFKDERIIKKLDTDSQCFRKNLYTLPEDFSMEEKKAIEIAFMGHVDSIYSKAMMNSYDTGSDPTLGDLNSLIWFVIYQSFRTPKFKQFHLSKSKEISLQIGKPEANIDEYSYWLGYLCVKVAVEIYDYFLLEILVTHNYNWFITSDNPASYWIKNWERMEYIGTPLGNDNRSDLKIICPINPQIVFIMHLNYLKKSNYPNTKDHITYFTRQVEKEEVKKINDLIFQASDKQIFSIDPQILERYKK